MQRIANPSGHRYSVSSDSLLSENPARPSAAGSLALARWLPVLLSFLLCISALYWLCASLHLRVHLQALNAAEGGSPSNADGGERHHSRQALLGRLSPDKVVPVFAPSVMHWAPQIQAWARAYDLNPNLVATVMQIESCGHPTIASPSGAIGLFQVMPYHFADGETPQDPETNAYRGLSYLAESLSLADGWLPGTLAGYNGGHGVIPRDRAQWPRQTRRYVRWGMGILKDISSGEGSSRTLRQWLDSGGDRLCEQANRVLADDQYSGGISLP